MPWAGQGISSKASQWTGRTTVKSRRSSVAMVVTFVEAFSDRDHRSVDEAEAEIFVAADQLDGSHVVGCGDVDDGEFTGDDRVDQRCFGFDTDVVFELPRGFRDDGDGNEEAGGVNVEQRSASGVGGVISVDRAEEHAGIDEDRHRFRSRWR